MDPEELGTIVQVVMQVLQQNNQNAQSVKEVEREHEGELKFLERFLKMKPMKFNGATKAEKAEGWLKHIKKRLDSLHVPHEYHFEEYSLNRYSPRALKQTKIQILFALEQGKMIVAEYVAKFTELGRFAASVMNDEDMKLSVG
ncbi:hypothetical protein ACE6H2_016257 [Prunus campanulata]